MSIMVIKPLFSGAGESAGVSWLGDFTGSHTASGTFVVPDDSMIAIAITWHHSIFPQTLDGVTIDGEAATIVQTPNGTALGAAIAYLPELKSGSIDMFIDADSSGDGNFIHGSVYALTGLGTLTPFDSVQATSSGASVSGTLDLDDGGVLIIAGVDNHNGLSVIDMTFSGIGVTDETVFLAFRGVHGCGHSVPTVAEVAHAVGMSSSSNPLNIAAASWV